MKKTINPRNRFGHIWGHNNNPLNTYFLVLRLLDMLLTNQT